MMGRHRILRTRALTRMLIRRRFSPSLSPPHAPAARGRLRRHRANANAAAACLVSAVGPNDAPVTDLNGRRTSSSARTTAPARCSGSTPAPPARTSRCSSTTARPRSRRDSRVCARARSTSSARSARAAGAAADGAHDLRRAADAARRRTRPASGGRCRPASARCSRSRARARTSCEAVIEACQDFRKRTRRAADRSSRSSPTTAPEFSNESRAEVARGAQSWPAPRSGS